MPSEGPNDDPDVRAAIARLARPRIGRSMLDLATSVLPYLALLVLMYLSLDVSLGLTLGLAVPAAGFLLRTYIIFHDCAHGSFLPSRGANLWLGRALGVLVYSPLQSWRHSHAVHHATAGNLDRRGTGDVTTWTVAEYRGRSRTSRLGYRLFRHPIVMFGLGPLWALAIQPRLVARSARPHIRRSVAGTNLTLLVLVGITCWLIGWQDYLVVQWSAALLAGACGVWLFYIQHQFEDAYWESADGWSYADAALRGSSYLKLPKVLQFFTGNIGLHHVHHLNARIPNYNLQRAHDENACFQDVPTVTLSDGLRAVRLKLWDEERGRLVTFSEALTPDAAATALVSPPVR